MKADQYDSAKDIVRAGYDRLGTAYRQHFTPLHEERYHDWIRGFSAHLVPKSKVLELGCADGIPVAAALAETYDYTGVDLSPVQIGNASKNVPQGTFMVGDMTRVIFSPGTFAGIVALYSIIHVPIEQQRPLISRIYDWLQPGGIFMAVVGAGNWTGLKDDWVLPQTTMYWSHAGGDEYAEWFGAAGFHLLDRTIVPEGEAAHTFMLLKKPMPFPS